MHTLRAPIRTSLGFVLASVLILFLTLGPTDADAELRRIKSVKALTHILSNIEKKGGDKAKFITMKLQIYLEDVYISQGTTISIKPSALGAAIGDMLRSGVEKEEIASRLVRMFQDGDFND